MARFDESLKLDKRFKQTIPVTLYDDSDSNHITRAMSLQRLMLAIV